MTERASSPKLTAYVVSTRLTRRLVWATDAEHAERLFLASRPMLRHLKRTPGDIIIAVADPALIDAFTRRRPRPPETMSMLDQ